ncbi:MAG: hypothetical protein ACTSQZ_04995 [Candidatus Thorarchaeota archaeon]
MSEKKTTDKDMILDRVETINGRVYRKEAVAIIDKFPNAKRFHIATKAEGEVKKRGGTKIKSYQISEDRVFIRITKDRFIAFFHH